MAKLVSHLCYFSNFVFDLLSSKIGHDISYVSFGYACEYKILTFSEYTFALECQGENFINLGSISKSYSGWKVLKCLCYNRYLDRNRDGKWYLNSSSALRSHFWDRQNVPLYIHEVMI